MTNCRQIEGFLGFQSQHKTGDLVAVVFDQGRRLGFSILQQRHHGLIEPRGGFVRIASWLRNLLAQKPVIFAVAQINRADVAGQPLVRIIEVAGQLAVDL